MSDINILQDDAFIEQIYSAPFQPDLWSEVLDGLAERVGAVGSGLLIQRNGNWLGWRASCSLEPQASESAAKFIFGPKRLPDRLLELNRPGFVADQELFDEEQFRELPFYKDLCEPCGLRHLAGTVIKLPSHDLMFLFSIREKSRPPFDTRDLNRLDSLRPHIARVGILTARLGLEKMRSFADAFSSISLPAIVINSKCNIIARNNAVDEYTDFIRIRADDVLEFNNSSSTTILKETARLLDQRISSSAKSIPITSINEDPAVAHIIPVGSEFSNFFDWKNTNSNLFHSACCAVIITPVVPHHVSDKALLRSLFDLTPAETNVAEELLAGNSTANIAIALRVTQETVRTHLKRIFSKTGVQSQPQLVSLLASITKVNPGNR